LTALMQALMVSAAYAATLNPACGAAAGCPQAAPPKPLVLATVEKPKNAFCDCLTQPTCDCKPKTIEPELKDNDVVCACIASEGCPCRPKNYQLIKDSCGCLHLRKCGCRQEFVQPEMKEKHQQPELTTKSSACGCLAEVSCGCRPKTQIPEIKADPTCACISAVNAATSCPCAGARL